MPREAIEQDADTRRLPHGPRVDESYWYAGGCAAGLVVPEVISLVPTIQFPATAQAVVGGITGAGVLIYGVVS